MTTKQRWLAGVLASLFGGCTAIGGLDKNYTESSCYPEAGCADGSVSGEGSPGDSTTPDVADVVHPGEAGEAGPEGAAESSTEAGCTDGARQCTGTTPETCVAGVWQSGVACPYVCSAGACTGVCVPKSLECDGQQPQTCDSTGTWQNTGSPCTNVCNQGQCAGACSPNTKQCSGLQPQTCDSAGTWSDTGSVCPYVCSSGNCIGSCAPNAQQCVNLTPQTCDGTGTWQSGTPCQYVCTGGTCSGVCVPGTHQCSSNTPQTCDTTGEWQSGTACGNATCDPINGTCVCQSPAMTCGGVCAACSTPANATATCSGTACTFTCDATYTQCGASTCANLPTDSANCGACGHACGTGSTCSAGVCSPVTVCTETALTGATHDVAVVRPNGGTLYWDLSVGACIQVGGCQWDVLSCPTGATGATPTIVTSGGGQHTILGLWPNGLSSFDYEIGTSTTNLHTGGLYRYSTAGSAQQLTNAEPQWMTDFSTGHIFYVDSSNATWVDEFMPEILTDAGAATSRFCEDGAITTLGPYDAAAGYLYVTDNSVNEVFRYTDAPYTTIACSNKTQVASGLSASTYLVADSDGAHFYVADANGVHACGATGTGCTTLGTGQGSVSQIVYDSTKVYWIGSAGLVECAKAGCGSAPLVLATNLPTTDPIDVDQAGPNVYYVQNQSIYRLAK